MTAYARRGARLALCLGLFGCGDRPVAVSEAPVDAPDAGAAALDVPLSEVTTDAHAASPPGSVPVLTEARAPCNHRNPHRNLYFGDLHVHTALSFDARVYQVIARPADAYRFARGEAVDLPPFDAAGKSARSTRLAAPLDFAAVTDHAEFLGEVAVCTTPARAGYDSATCKSYRANTSVASIAAFGTTLAASGATHLVDVCGDRPDCTALADGLWAETVAAAQAADDKTATCAFTAFVAYEYSNSTDLSNLHRNVIFRNASVPKAPVTFLDAATPEALWARLRAECTQAGSGCDVLAIPHNSNWSNGRMFRVVPESGAPSTEGVPAQAQAALERVTMEPIVEIFQHKGDSECMNGFPGKEPDPFCDFEKLTTAAKFEDCGATVGQGAMAGFGCTHRLDFVREALKEGLREEARLGVNPFQLGVIASTDTHAALPGAVDEDSWPGHLGDHDDRARERLASSADGLPGGFIENPGGLAAVWSVENSRDALFEAMRRRETYGTSGPRLAVRFFGGAGLPSDLCTRPDLVQQGYALGVPMGGVLAATSTQAPTFVVQALRDPRETAAPLARVQIVKGWLDADGKTTRETIIDVAVATTTPTLDTSTCLRTGSGPAELCGSWTDPTWIPGQRAVWYARVIEAPSCRWSQWLCKGLSGASRPATCDDPALARTVQERAWTSPIWSVP